MSLPQTEIIVLLRQIPGFSKLLFEELQLLVPLVDEAVYLPGDNVPCSEGHSIVYRGTINRGDEVFTRGTIITQLDPTQPQAVTRAKVKSTVLHIPESRMHALMRKEPELTLFVMEHIQQQVTEDNSPA